MRPQSRKWWLMILATVFVANCPVAQILKAQTLADQQAKEHANSIEKSNDVKIVFQNTTRIEIKLRILATSDDKNNNVVEGIAVHPEHPIPRNRERTYASRSGLIWELLNPKEEVLALYTTGEDPRQIVDIQQLISWQQPVKINFRNDTEKNVNIFWKSPEGRQVLMIQNMPPGTDLKEPMTSMPNQLWTIEQDGQFFADYIPNELEVQIVDLKELKTWFLPVEITFNNTTDKDLEVFLMDLDGELVKYSGDRPLKRGKMIQPANPLTRWILKHGDNVIAEYVATNEKQQECKITAEFLNL